MNEQREESSSGGVLPSFVRLTLIAALGFGMIYMNYSPKNRGLYIGELSQFVANHDNEQGISLEDALDFGEKAGISNQAIRENYVGGELDFSKYSTGTLKKALEAYKK